MQVYYNGQYQKKSQVGISPDDRGFLFGDGVYEVLRYYGRRFLAADRHVRRLARSLESLRIVGVEAESIVDIGYALLEQNDLVGEESIFYIQVTRGVAPRSHAFPKRAVNPTVYACVQPFVGDESAMRKGVKACLVEDFRWRRCDIKSTALVANVLANQYAVENHCREAIFHDGRVITEGSHTNIVAVIDGVLHYHPIDNRVLAGVTLEVVLQLCQEMNIPTIAKAIELESLKQIDELFLVGTTSEVTPIIRVDDSVIGSGTVGGVTGRIQDRFRAYANEHRLKNPCAQSDPNPKL